MVVAGGYSFPQIECAHVVEIGKDLELADYDPLFAVEVVHKVECLVILCFLLCHDPADIEDLDVFPGSYVLDHSVELEGIPGKLDIHLVDRVLEDSVFAYFYYCRLNIGDDPAALVEFDVACLMGPHLDILSLVDLLEDLYVSNLGRNYLGLHACLETLKDFGYGNLHFLQFLASLEFLAKEDGLSSSLN